VFICYYNSCDNLSIYFSYQSLKGLPINYLITGLNKKFGTTLPSNHTFLASHHTFSLSWCLTHYTLTHYTSWRLLTAQSSHPHTHAHHNFKIPSFSWIASLCYPLWVSIPWQLSICVSFQYWGITSICCTWSAWISLEKIAVYGASIASSVVWLREASCGHDRRTDDVQSDR
jgi:hypothetical protein